MKMQASIASIGTAVPSYTQSQQKTAEIVANALLLEKASARLLKSIYRATGIIKRHSVLSDFCKEPGQYEFFPNNFREAFPSTATRMQMYKANALPLALTAIQNCFNKLTAFDTKSITHLITVSCTGMYAPGIDIEIVQQLNLSPNTKRTCINFMGCYGTFNALKVADTICKAEVDAVVLIVSVELCTIHFQQSDTTEYFVSNAIFSDGAAAALVSRQALTPIALNLMDFYCDLLPQHSEDMAWTISNQGFDIVLSSYVPQAIETGIATFCTSLLARNELALHDIDWYAIHPGGQKILEACEKSLKISSEQNKHSYDVLQQFGNMSSATILFVLENIWSHLNATHADDKIFSCAFGPGLTLESMLLSVQTMN